MTLQPRLSFTVTILIAFTLVFALGVGLAIFGFRSAGERAAVATDGLRRNVHGCRARISASDRSACIVIWIKNHRHLLRTAACICLTVLSGCTAPLQCTRVGGTPMLEYQLFFGRTAVSDQDWTAFTAQVVTPNLPDGFTAFDADGQWLNPETNRIGKERTKVIFVAVPDTPAAAAAIGRVKDEYRARFAQLSVGTTIHQVCGAF